MKISLTTKEWREKGNCDLRRSRNAGIPGSVATSRGFEALRSYRDAMETAENPHDRARALKNSSIVYLDMVKRSLDDLHGLVPILSSCGTTSGGWNHTLHAFESYLSYWFNNTENAVAASLEGLAANEEDCDEYWSLWRARLLMNFVICLHDIFETCAGLAETKDAVGGLVVIEKVAYSTTSPEAKALLCYHVANYHHGIVRARMRNKDVSEKVARHHLAEMYRPIQEGISAAKQIRSIDLALDDSSGAEAAHHPALELYSELLKEIHILKSEMSHLEAHVNAQVYLVEGEAMLEGLDAEDDTVDLEAVWIAVDKFRNAVVEAREVDLETEARAFSGLGKCFTKYLSFPNSRGKDCYHQAIVIGLAMQPRSFDNDEWFVEAKEGLAAYQHRMQVNDVNKVAEEEAPFRAELKEEIKELDNLSSDHKKVDEFLIYVYGTYPPKKSSQTRDSTDSFGKQLRNALIHYHPDKNKDFGMRWKVLCIEISKCCSSLYEHYKHQA